MASVTEELNFTFHLILINLHLNVWLGATIFDSAGLEHSMAAPTVGELV